MVTTRLRRLVVGGERDCHNPHGWPSSLASCQKEAQHLARCNAIGCGHMRAEGGAKRVLKNVVQIARKPCHGMGTGVVSLLQGFCRVWLSKLHG